MYQEESEVEENERNQENYSNSVEKKSEKFNHESPVLGKRKRSRPKKILISVQEIKRKRGRPWKIINNIESARSLTRVRQRRRLNKNENFHEDESDPEYLKETYSDEFNDENSIISDESRDEDFQENFFENKNHVSQESESEEDYLNDEEFDFPVTQENAEMTDDEIRINNHDQRPPRKPPFPIPPHNLPQSSMKKNVNKWRNVVECRDQMIMRKDNYVYFLSSDGTPRDNGSKSLEKRNELPQFKNLILGEAKEIQRGNFYHIALPIESESGEGLSGILENIKNVIQSLHEILTIIKNTFSNASIKIIICNGITQFANTEQRNSLIEEAHSSALGGHKGVTKTYNRIRQKYFWENMKLDIQKYIQVCLQCQLKKLVRVKTKNPMVITDTPGVAFEKISMDIVGPLPVTKSGNECILTIQDNLTKYSLAIPLPNQQASTIADAFVKRFICIFGSPKGVLTDQGTNF